jgi:amino acid adenylation domain-containing protein/non-ribosomal peptide synthase protein (TIGR01720 family)
MFETESSSSTLVDILRRRSAYQADRVAYTFLLDGESEEISITYAELDRQARTIAAALQSRLMVGDRVLLLYPPGLEYIAAFFGCLYAGVAAVPLYPPRRNRSLLRLQTLVANAEASAVLTTSAILGRVSPSFSENPALEKLHWLTAESMASGVEHDWQQLAISADHLAFLQYTSGSTSAPKGVMLSHRNLLHNERLIQAAFQQTEDSIILGWLPLYHDMGLIGNVLQALFVGARCILFSPVAFLQRPCRWLQAISTYRATTSGGPNFAYDLCVRKITAEQRAALDLSEWKVAFNGAEPVRAETMKRFAETFAPSGFREEAFRPCYGMAEATLLISASRSPLVAKVSRSALERGRIEVAAGEEHEVRRLVGCGKAIGDEEVLIVNPESRTACEADEVGEIWVASASVAAGYWNDPIATAETFNARVAGREHGAYLRTGDLGFIHAGEIFLTGRLKDLIIIRGSNHYPQDIELSIEQSHPALRPGCGAAFSVNVEGEERLVVIQELEPHGDPEAIIAAMRETLSEEHELQAQAIVLLKPGSIPKTTSGKIQRRLCRAMFLQDGLEVVAQWQASSVEVETSDARSARIDEVGGLENWLRAQLAAQLKIAAAQIELDQPIMRYGLDSLTATELAHAIETELGVVFHISGFLRNPSIVQLAAQLREQLPVPAPVSRAVQSNDAFPLSHGQKALWYLQQIAPQSAAYNIARAARIVSPLERRAFRRALQSLVDRHAALRTTFHAPQGEPIQRVHERVQVSFHEEHASAWTEPELHERLLAEANRAFDLEAGPLLRVGLFARSANEHVLLFVVHHIIVDLWSLAVLIDELGALYKAECTGAKAELPHLPLAYADYVRWQNDFLAGEDGERQWQFWREQLDGEIPILNLPTDKPRPPVQSFRGASYSFAVPAPLTHALTALSHECEATLFMTLLAAFQLLLARYTRQDDIIVGSPTTGRQRAEFANLVGYFVNPIVLRADLSGRPTFKTLLRQVRQTALAAFEHQNYPFPLIVKRLQLERDPSRPPLFQAEFAWQKTHGPTGQSLAVSALGGEGATAQLQFGGLTIETLALTQQVEQFDLTLMMAEAGDGLTATLEYGTDLFAAATIERMAGHFLQLLDAIVADPERRVSELSLLTEVERRHFVEWNDTVAPYPRGKCVHELFAEQAALTPEAVAVVSEDRSLTFAELNARANQLAHRLRRLEVGPDVAVGLWVERSPEMIVGMLGILKAGGAYVPFDSQTPPERLALMLHDTAAPVLLTQHHLAERVPLDVATVLRLDTDWAGIAEESAEDAVNEASADNLAYIIYTSGSTGTPKGVMVQHDGLVNYLNWCVRFCAVAEGAGAPVHTSISFDLGMTALFAPLVAGRSLVLAREDEGPSALAGIMRSGHDFSLIKLTPSHLEVLKHSLEPHEIAGCAKTLVIGGEALQFEALSSWRANARATRLINHYGPTETTIGCCVYEVPDESPATGPVPIGMPIDNKKLYVLDARQQPAPIGVAGEIYIGGVGVARGYLKRPDLTADKFVPDPFSDESGTRMYRTGDLARRLADGNIELLGRMDQQVKIRGYRVEPGEIEGTLVRHRSVRDVAIVAETVSDRATRLIAYVVVNHDDVLDAGELRRYLKESLPDYMVPSAFVMLDELPLTLNGKLDRRRLPSADETSFEFEKEFVAPRNDIERRISAVWKEVLRVERVGIHDNFFELGGDSILSIQIVARVNQGGVRLTPKQLFQHHTVAELAAVISQTAHVEQDETTVTGVVPLTPIQHWFFEQRFADQHHWNQAVMLELHEALEVPLLEKAVAHLVVEQPSLRLRFTRENGEWRQRVANDGESSPFSYIDLSALPPAERQGALAHEAAALQSSLSLSDGPILRVACFDVGAEQPGRLLVVVHHLAMDAISWRILLEDLWSIYQQLERGAGIKTAFQTASFPRWANRLLTYAQAPARRDEAAFWLAQPQDAIGRLPVDGDTSHNSYEFAAAVTVQLSAAETQSLLYDVPHRYRTQINEVLLTALGQTLSRWLDQKRVLIDVEGHGREALFDDVDVSRTIGWFTTHYPVALEIDETLADPGEVLLSVKEQVRRIPNHGIGYGLLRYVHGDGAIAEQLRALPQAEIIFNYLGRLDHALPEAAPFRVAAEPAGQTHSSGRTHSPRAQRSHLLEVIGSVREGTLRLDWIFNERVHRRSTIGLVASEFIQSLRLLIAHCQSVDTNFYTPSDFPLVQLSQEQLDHAFAEVSFED